jgi:xanthine dehydrogenase small subunit
VIESIALPLTSRLFHFEKVSRRRFLDVAAVNTAISFEVEGDHFGAVSLAVGGVAPIPLLAVRTAARLAGAPIELETLRAAAELLDEEIAPIGDVRGSERYKRLLARRLFFAHFLTLLPGRGLEELL